MTAARRRWIASLGLLAAIGCGVRVIHLLEVRDSPRWQVMIGDAGRYHAWAGEIAAGDWIGSGTFYQAPLYPYFLGLIYRVTGPEPIAARCAQACIGILSSLLLAMAGRQFFGGRAGWLAGLILAIWPAQLFHESLIEKSTLTTLLVCTLLLGVAATLRAPRRPGVWFGIGVTLGLLSLVRENALVLPALLLLWIIRLPRSSPSTGGCTASYRAPAAAMLILGLAVTLFPVFTRNRIVGGDWRLTTAQFGPNFFIGNSADADGTYRELIPERGTPTFEQQDATDLAESAAGRVLSPGEVSAWWTRRALVDIRANPARWLRLQLQKIALTWTNREMADSEDQYTAATESTLLGLLTTALPFGLLTALAVIGLVLLGNRLSRLWVLPGLLVVYTASVAAFYLFARYRLPLVPVLALLAGAGLVRSWTLARGFRSRTCARLMGGLVVGGMFGLLTLPGIVGPWFADWPDLSVERMRAVTEFNLALRLWEQDAGQDVVERHLASSTGHYPEYASAWLYWGYVLKESRDQGQSIKKLQRAAECDPDGADIRLALGEALLSLKRVSEAEPHLIHAVALAPDDAMARQLLGRAYYMQGEFAAAEEELAEALRVDPEYIEARRLRAMTLDRLGRRAESDREFSALLDLLPAEHPESQLIRRRLSRQRSFLQKVE